MRPFVTALFLGLSAGPAFADDTTTSALIAEKGLTAALTHLESQPPSADRDMALGAVTFLAGIERSYHDRWRVGASVIPLTMPVFGTNLTTPNPAPQTMEADFFNTLATDLTASMQATRAALPEDGGDGAIVLKRGDLWFDINGNGTRDPSESFTSLMMMGPFEREPVEMRFDAADVHWLRAYTHLIEATAKLTLAFDPQQPMAQMLELRAMIDEQKQGQPEPEGYSEMSYFGDLSLYADTFAVLIQTLRQQPDKALIAETEQHIRQMIAENRAFWTAVAAETDNDREWIPNDNQQSALGFPIPPGAGAAWLGVLANAEQVLDGDLLVPYWRFADGHGVNLRAWLDDPQPVDLIGWIQGTAAMPYAASGTVMDGSAWNSFVRMTEGNAGLYMVLFN